MARAVASALAEVKSVARRIVSTAPGRRLRAHGWAGNALGMPVFNESFVTAIRHEGRGADEAGTPQNLNYIWAMCQTMPRPSPLVSPALASMRK